MPRQQPNPDTAVRRAVEAVGGPTAAARMLGVTTRAVQLWLAQGWVPGLWCGLMLADAAGIDPHELAEPHRVAG